MEQKKVIAIFNEKLNTVFNEQEKLYQQKRERKYSNDVYCCSENEKDNFSKVFKDLIEKKDKIDYENFINMFKEKGDKS